MPWGAICARLLLKTKVVPGNLEDWNRSAVQASDPLQAFPSCPAPLLKVFLFPFGESHGEDRALQRAQ